MIDISADYLGLDGFADAKRDCEADETCKSIVDVSKAFGLEHRGEVFQLCKSGADEILNSKDTSRAWDELKKFANFKSNTGPPDLLVEDGKEVKDERSIAELLNTQFRTKVNQITERLPVDTKKSATLMEEFFGTKKFKDWDMQEVDCEDVRKAIDSLKNTPATGSDGIPTVVLKQLKYEIAPYLTYLCNQIIRTRVYPT